MTGSGTDKPDRDALWVAVSALILFAATVGVSRINRVK